MADDEEGAPISDEEMAEEDSMSTGDGSNGANSEAEQLYEVEQIVGMKKNTNGIKVYKVRWKGYSKAFDTWEPVENLESCLDMVEEFEEVKEKEKKKRSDERKKRMALMAGRSFSTEDECSEYGLQPNEEPVMPIFSPPPLAIDAEPTCTLKDTFWKDLEEGRINLFNTDMYSKVKGQGRASRPKSFKTHFKGRATEDKGKEKREMTAGDGIEGSRKQNHGETKRGKQPKSSRGRSISAGGKTTTSQAELKETYGTDGVRRTSSCTSDLSEASSDSSDVVMAQVLSVSTPSPPVLSCVEDYSDDSSRDFSDHRYSSPADITGSISQSPNCSQEARFQSLSPDLSQEAVSEDTGIGMDGIDLLSPQREVKDTQLVVGSNCENQNDIFQTATEKTSTEKESSIHREKTVRVEDTLKTVTDVKKTVTQTSELKTCKKSKVQVDFILEGHKVPEKKFKLDPESIKQKHRHKSTCSNKEGSSRDSVYSAPLKTVISACAKTGKENVGDKHVANIFTGLSNVLHPSIKPRGPTGGRLTDPRMETSTSQANNTCETGKVTTKRKECNPNDFAQPLEKILNSSLLPILPDNKTILDKGADVSFDIDLDDIDLDELEKQLTLSPSAQPVELSDDELKQAVWDGDYDLVKRAFAARKLYDIEQADDTGTTLLMHAILRNFDDIAEVLVCSGAKINTQQKNGNTALMIAAEQAHICTVALLLEMGAKINLQQANGETALMKAVKRGHRQIVRYLLESGANFSYQSYSCCSALSYAKLHRLPDVEDIIVDHISRLTTEFDRQVAITLNNTAQILSALFPLQCFPLAETDKFVITFKNEVEPITPGVGFLLFIAHARITPHEVKCRFYGPCAVKSVFLNGVKQPSMTEEANFVLSCHPVLPGKNELCIHTESAVSSKAKLVVCAYKAQLIQ
ncbi:M-phase phosphoprotein 8-like [Haliotis rubra]|uniref:M-phase phosphoprotein 8-like n=1 Tax=Haliotis rubra TaxID=36100 RepID=UPI001EE54DBD|nr:M-phase phosphoprotein 8-like [Haliotis rubra]